MTLAISVNECELLPVPMITLFKRRITSLNISTAFIKFRLLVPSPADFPSYHDFTLALILGPGDCVLKYLVSGNVSYCYVI